MTNIDFQQFRLAYNTATPSRKQISVFDVDGDNLIDILPDFDTFRIAYFDPNAQDLDRDNNGTSDLEDILAGDLTDNDNNGIPDEFEVQTPFPASAPHDILKNRYLSFDPNNDIEVALRLDVIDGPGATGTLGYIDAPDANGVSRVVNEPVYRTWTTNPIHVGDCQIAPAAIYEVRADDGLTLSAPLTLETIEQPGDQFWADIVGSFDAPTQTWTGPNGIVNFSDIAASIQRFQEKSTAPHFTATDLHPEVPNEMTNFNDIGMIIDGFQGKPYPYSNPMNCP